MIVAGLKFLHLAAMLCWCAALIALPLMLYFYGNVWRRTTGSEQTQARYAEFRLITHYGYIAFATPAAIIAIAAGTALIFADDVFDLWFVAKLALVAGMVLVHAWIGHLILSSAENRGLRDMPSPVWALVLGLPLMAAVLWLVLAKPDLGGLTALMPDFMLAPRGQAGGQP
ncbi:MAG: CopD family protein [Paracoccus sp. (in: a-proteobacteria)]|uniref:CopD family protein n=1 Tax=Paracoccus sp. TaxID=267 RepID=UPI00391AC1E0